MLDDNSDDEQTREEDYIDDDMLVVAEALCAMSAGPPLLAHVVEHVVEQTPSNRPRRTARLHRTPRRRFAIDVSTEEEEDDDADDGIDFAPAATSLAAPTAFGSPVMMHCVVNSNYWHVHIAHLIRSSTRAT